MTIEALIEKTPANAEVYLAVEVGKKSLQYPHMQV